MNLRPLALALALGFAVGCHRDPRDQLSTLLQQARSWSAAADFARERQRAGSVSPAYVQQVAARGVEEVGKIKSTIAGLDVETSQKTQALAECDAALTTLAGSQRTGDAPAGERR